MKTSKKVIALTEDKIEFLRFDVEWDAFDQLQDFINLSKSNLYEDGLKAQKLIGTMEKLLEQRNNLIGASMVFDSINNPQ